MQQWVWVKSSLEQFCHRLFKKAVYAEGEMGGKERHVTGQGGGKRGVWILYDQEELI